MKFKNKISSVLLAVTLIPSVVFAKGSTIVTLGADLKESQRSEMLREMNAKNDDKIIEVTNKEEYQYLGDVLTSKEIGNRALSAAKITFQDKDYGLDIKLSPNIRVVTAEAIKNALGTVGVEDADIYVTAPGKLSGTAALTGILKAYEEETGKELSEDIKKVANQEVVVQTKLSEEVGDEKANDIIYQIKDAMAKNMPQNETEVRNIINNVSNNYNITLTDGQKDKLVSLFNNMKNADVDWDRVADTVKEYKDKAGKFLNSPEGKKAVQDTKNILEKIIDFIVSLFK